MISASEGLAGAAVAKGDANADDDDGSVVVLVVSKGSNDSGDDDDRSPPSLKTKIELYAAG